jgi:hypothetical protein
MWRIDTRLYLGDYHSGLDALAGAERPVDPEGHLAPFAGVVSLCPMPLYSDETIAGPASPFIEWLHIPILDGGNGEEEFESALGVVLPFVRRRSADGNVLVHCAAGVSRSVAVVVACLCEHGLSVDAALRHVARSKAGALHSSSPDADDLVAPAWEFRACLGRLYGPRSGLGKRPRREPLTNGR